MELTWIVLITVCTLLVLGTMLVVGVAICLCRRNPITVVNDTNNESNNVNRNLNQLQCEYPFLANLYLHTYIAFPIFHDSVYQTNLNGNNCSKNSTLPREQTTRLPSDRMMENGMNGNHTIPRNFNLSLETTSIDLPAVNFKCLMGQEIAQTNSATKDEWFV